MIMGGRGAFVTETSISKSSKTEDHPCRIVEFRRIYIIYIYIFEY